MPGTILLLGHPFSGSTLLTYLLGEHSEVWPVGELFWRHCYARETADTAHPELHRAHMGGEGSKAYTQCERCRVLQVPCPVWPGIKEPIATPVLYATLRQRLNTPWVVDSSKAVWWYRAVLKATPRGSFLGVLLHKSPWAWIGSNARYKIPEFSTGADWETVSDDFIRTWALTWAGYIQGYTELCSDFKLPIELLSYEAFVGDWSKAARRIWDRLAVKESPGLPTARLDSWSEQHHLGGNAKLRRRMLDLLGELGRDAKMPITVDPLAVDTPPGRVIDVLRELPTVAEGMTAVGRAFP